MPNRPADSGEFVDRFLHPDSGAESRTAVATRSDAGWEELTYGQLADRTRAVAAGLAHQGVPAGGRVVLCAEAGGSWLAGLLGILRRGAVAVPIDPGLTEAERAPLLDGSAPDAVLGAEELDALVATGAEGAKDEDWSLRRRLDDVALVVWTSGTTGAPKGVALSFANIAYSVEQAVAAQQPSPDDRWLSVLPAHHLLELCCGLLPALASGGSVTFAHTLMPHELAGIIAERRISKVVAVPLLLRLLEPVAAGTGLVTAFCGGAPLDPALVERYASMGIAVYPGYGLTEAAPTVSMNTPAHHRSGSVGRPLAGTDVRIARSPGDESGEILVRSPGVMAGYWRDDGTPAAGDVIDVDGWLHTGDLGLLDDDGFLFVTGRRKRLVVLESGKKVQPEEVEAALSASELLADVCVVGTAGIRGGEQVCAVVVPSPALLARHPGTDALFEAASAEVARCAAHLSGYKRPTAVKVHRGAFPRTLKGSPRHTAVAEMVDEGLL